MTIEEMTRAYEIADRSRTLTEFEVVRMLIYNLTNTLSVDDNMALRMTDFYPEWEVGKDYAKDYKVRYRGRLYKVLQAHTSQQDWTPDAASSLWTEVCESHAGTEDDPIPYSGNMALESGKYYIQDYVIYLCNRDTVNPIYNTLAELVGIYVEIV